MRQHEDEMLHVVFFYTGQADPGLSPPFALGLEGTALKIFCAGSKI